MGSTPAIAGQNPAQIEGTVKATGIIQGTWRGATGETGWFNMQPSPDGKSFSGEYGFNGRKAEGKIIGHLTTDSPTSAK